MLDLSNAIDLSSNAWVNAESRLQGHIVRHNGRDHVAMILFSIDPNKAPRQGIGRLAASYVTSAERQRIQARDRAENPWTLFGSLYLSACGYERLGFSRDEVEAAFRPDSHRQRNWFLDGMQQKLKDYPTAFPPRPQLPLTNYPGVGKERLDAMLLLAQDGDSPNCLDAVVAEARDTIATIGTVLSIERGGIKRSNGLPVEPFGFADSIEMPTIIPPKTPNTPLVPPYTLLVPDPLANDPHAYGSHIIFMKLKQDVSGFNAAMECLAKKANVPLDYAKAMVMGRFPNGTPLSNSPAPTTVIDTSVPDLFNDLNGTKCPFHAHVRSVNPRFHPSGRSMSNPLFRRSVSYNQNGEEGLLFMAMQADIFASYGYVMMNWVNDPNFPVANSGTDALIGSQSSAQSWPGARIGSGVDVNFDIGRHVQFQYGEFFFAPSIPFFQSL